MNHLMLPYVIKSGDTFYNLAQQQKIPLNELLLANPGINHNNIAIDQVINLPIKNPVAFAKIKGGPLRPQIEGIIKFFRVPDGTFVCAEITGLPPYQPTTKGKDPVGPHGFHIHEFGNCEVGNPQEPFQAAGGHWNPTNQPHGNHAGDFPVLFSNQGYAQMCFFTNKFKPEDVIGKAVIIHQNPDDYRTQPAGAAGKRLACGFIQNQYIN